MNIDIGLLGSISREGIAAFYKSGVSPTLLEDPGARVAYAFIEKYWEEHACLPQVETIRSETGVDILASPVEPMAFWCSHLKSRDLYNKLNTGLEPVVSSLEKIKPEQALAEMQGLVYRLTQEEVVDSGPTSVFENPEEIIEDHDLAKKGLTGVPTPWPSLDYITKGWQPGDLGLVAARPGKGKTFLLLMLAHYAWSKGFSVLVASTEMSHLSLRRRIVSQVLKLPYKNFRDGRLSVEQRQSLIDGLNMLKDDKRFQLYGDGFDVSVSSIEAAIIEKKPDLVLIDGIYLVKSAGFTKDGKSERIAEVLNQTKSLGKRRGVPVIVTTQMNRPPNDKAGAQVDSLSRLAFTDNAGMVADYVFFIKQTKEMKENCQLEIEPGKVRESDFEGNIRLNWDFDEHDFTEVISESSRILLPNGHQEKEDSGSSPPEIDAPLPDFESYGALPPDDPW